MKKLPLILGLALGLTSFYSCSKDDATVLQEESQKVEFGIKLNFSDLTKAIGYQELDWQENCLDPDAIDPSLHHLYISYKVNGGALQDVDDLSITVDNANQLIYSDLIKFDAGSTIEIWDVKIHDAAHNPLYSTLTVDADPKYASLIPSDDYLMPLEYKIESYKKIYQDVFLLCASNVTPKEFGYTSFNVGNAQIFCFKYMINLCGDPCDPSAPMKHSVANGIFKIQKYVNGVASGDPYYSDESSEGVLGELCFLDHGQIADTDESFSVEFTVNNALKYTKLFTMAEIRAIESDVRASNDQLLHIEICPDSWRGELSSTIIYIDDSGINDSQIGEIEFDEVEKLCPPECPELPVLSFVCEEHEAPIGWIPSREVVTQKGHKPGMGFVQKISFEDEVDYFTWRTQVFNYTEGENVVINMLFNPNITKTFVCPYKYEVIVTPYDKDGNPFLNGDNEVITFSEDFYKSIVGNSYNDLVVKIEGIESQCLILDVKFVAECGCSLNSSLYINSIEVK